MMTSAVRTAAAALFLLGAIACSCAATEPVQPLEVVPHVDLGRYSGTWFEIASFPQFFTKGCSNTRADYRPLPDGAIEVRNSCFRDGRTDTARGKAWVADKGTNAKLKVSFFWPFRGDYWIIELGRDYDYAVVSAPGRKYLWILSRTPTMDESRYREITDRLRSLGFDMNLLQRTEHKDR